MPDDGLTLEQRALFVEFLAADRRDREDGFTRKHLHEKIDDLRGVVSGLAHKVNTIEVSTAEKFLRYDQRFAEFGTRLGGVEAFIGEFKAEVGQMRSDVHDTGSYAIKVEELSAAMNKLQDERDAEAKSTLVAAMAAKDAEIAKMKSDQAERNKDWLRWGVRGLVTIVLSVFGYLLVSYLMTIAAKK